MAVKNKQYQDIHEKCIKNVENCNNKDTNQIELEELKDYQDRQQNNKKINQSIMVTYQQNQNIRQQHINKQINVLINKHQTEIKKIKQLNDKQKKIQDDNISQYKIKYQQLLIQLDKRKLQHDKKQMQLTKKYEYELKKQLQKKQQQIQSHIQILQHKLKQAQSLTQMYKDVIYKKKYGIYHDYGQCWGQRLSQEQSIKKNCLDFENQGQSRQSRMTRIKNIQQNNIQDRKRLSASRQSVKLLTVKIDRALTQLKGSNNSKLHQRINEKLANRL